ncbi:protein FAN-like isoform X2 [Dendronephthya gigantea]|uniref:protein FAN-like isoform X2 n=1 Tax=Dendronephthya gigantea TaxID=151771 RepID=UPI00106A0A4C|nr:protein FAN-like isoform X2 [Dendronephthya gigantea]
MVTSVSLTYFKMWNLVMKLFSERDMTVNRLRESIALLTEKSDGIVHSFKRRLSSAKSDEDEKWDLGHFEKLINLEASVSEARSCRFSLLLLEPAEIYFEDFSVFYYPVGTTEDEAVKRKQRGRLKLCSHSVLFDPLDTAYPILKFPFKDIKSMKQWTGPLLSRIDSKGNVLSVETSLVVKMKEGNTIAPYVFIREKTQQYLFSFNFIPLSSIINQLQQLLRAASLPFSEHSTMIETIVKSRQSKISFNTSWLEDLFEKIVLETTAERITPLVVNPGRILLTSARIYFQPFNNVEPFPVMKCKLCSVRRVVKRRYLLRHVGVEIFSEDQAHMLLVFPSQKDRDKFYDLVLQQPALELQDTGQENMTLKWQNGVISNFDYLMYLNSLADRSFNDLTQYPVFPWVIADYKSKDLDLNNPKTFRDFTKPIGALNETRLKQLKDRCKDMAEPKFLYGSHYSTPGYVLYYLARVAPEYLLCLQGGKFDQPDRLFNSVGATWKNVLAGHADVKELIPEFYQSSGEFLVNRLNLPLGVKQDKTQVHDVELPAWASGPKDFIRKCREALECPYVSDNIHDWIDLIFGYKQQGEEAWKANNVFYYLTYEGAVDLDSITDPNERASLESQILEFGQTPKQLFTSPHPRRSGARISTSVPQTIDLLNGVSSLDMRKFEPFLMEDVDQEVTVTDTNVSLDEQPGSPHWSMFEKLQNDSSHRLHKDCVTSVRLSLDGKSVFSVSQDTQLKMFSLNDKQQVRSINLSSMALSSCAIMPDSKTIVVGSWDNNIYIYSVEYGRVTDTVRGHDDAISCLCWNDGILVTASWDSTVKVWKFVPECGGKKASSPELLTELDHDTEVNSVDLHPTNTLVVTGTTDGHVLLWNIDKRIIINEHEVHGSTVHTVAFSPDGQRILSCGADQCIRVLDVQTGTELYLKDLDDEIRCAVWDGQLVMAGGSSGQLHIWNLLNDQEVQRVEGHQGPIRCVDVSRDGLTVATGGEDNQVILWKIAV